MGGRWRRLWEVDALADMASFGAVLFDLDHTLYDRWQAGRLRDEWFVDTHLSLSSAPERQAALDLLTELDMGGYGDKRTLFATVRRHYPVLNGDDEMLRAAYVDRLVESLTPSDETAALLNALQDARVPFGVVTNGTARTQRRKLDALGVSRLTPCVFVSEEFGCKKPDPRIFAAASSCLGVPSGRTLFVGDHCELDVFGAHRAGMKTAWLKRQQDWPADMPITPDYTLATLADVNAILGLTKHA